MSFFNSLLLRNHLAKHDGRFLWEYSLSDQDYETLRSEINYSKIFTTDPRDATLYYAEWWKRNYNGGKPSKKEVFESLKGNINFLISYKEFYKLARQGANMLGVKWISKQNTLYFRTLLLQGGLPLNHISENQGKYQAFLIAVLDEQPETIDDFIFRPEIISLLPASSQNEIIYENCLEIVKSILNDEETYDQLLNFNESIKSISGNLRIRKSQLERKQRISKPKNYWLLSFRKDSVKIHLRVGLADSYSSEDLAGILGFAITEKDYQFYVNDELICAFRKMLNGKFKTEWYQQQDHQWNGESDIPYTYVISQGKKIEVRDFIQMAPNLQEPTLWSKFSENEWRLNKGNRAPQKEAAILFPEGWESTRVSENFSFYGLEMNWLKFEGEIKVFQNTTEIEFLSEVKTFDWTTVSQKPSWILKANIPVIQKKPQVIVYDEDNKRLPNHRFNVWYKVHNDRTEWIDLSDNSGFPLGCIDLRIEMEDVIAYDMCFNIGNLRVNYCSESLTGAEIEIQNFRNFDVKLNENELINIQKTSDRFNLTLNTEHRKIPTEINGSIGLGSQRKLHFTMPAPFKDMVLMDRDGNIVEEDTQLSLTNLYGLRVLNSPNKETLITLKNILKPGVKITKVIPENSFPVISFKNEISRLYYLTDVMDYKNLVTLEVREGNNIKSFKISGFSHTLNVEDQFLGQVNLFNSSDDLDLYAIPVNCRAEEIQLIPLLKEDNLYRIPEYRDLKQFIIISSNDFECQLMPRFVNTDQDYLGELRDTRIENFATDLLSSDFSGETWKQLLAYFPICVEHNLPFSTYDQFRAIIKSPELAARAFFVLGINYPDQNNFIQNIIPDMEMDLGFCFHWIKKDHWENALMEANILTGDKYFMELVKLLNIYLQDNNLSEIGHFIQGENIQAERVGHSQIYDLRSNLGERVLKELPNNKPHITKTYNIPVEDHSQVGLLIHSPIAVAESIKGLQLEKPIWGGDDFRNIIRRNIQYSQYLNPEFYKKTILHALKYS